MLVLVEPRGGSHSQNALSNDAFNTRLLVLLAAKCPQDIRRVEIRHAVLRLKHVSGREIPF